MIPDFATREPALAAAFAEEQKAIDDLRASMDPDGPAELASDGTATAVKQADLRARFLQMGEPVVYVPMCPASHYGGPRAYVKRPDGDETQFVIVEVENR